MDQVLNHFVCRIGMNLQFGRQCADRRKWLPRNKLAANKCFLGGEHQLLKDRFSRLKLSAEYCHTITVTQVTLQIKRNNETDAMGEGRT